MAGLTFKGDMSKVRWTKRVSNICSYCGAVIDEEGEDYVALRLFHPNGTGAVFCDLCSGRYFGLVNPS